MTTNDQATQDAKRQAYLEADVRHELKAHQSGKTLMVASALAAMASVTGRIVNQSPEMQHINPLLSGYDMGSDEIVIVTDYSRLEERLAEAANYLDRKPEPIHHQQFGRAKRIPMEQTYPDVAEEGIYKTAYNTQSPKGREGANNGKAEKALAKRRAANKVARKARRK